MPQTVAPCSSRSSVWPPPPSVQSTMNLPGPAFSMSTVSCNRTVMCRKPVPETAPSASASTAATASSPSSEIRASTLAAASLAFRASVWYASSQFMEGASAFQEQTSSSTPFSSVSSAITCTWLRQTLHASTRQDVSSASPFARASASSVRTCVPAPARKESSIWLSKARFRPEDNAPSLP